MIREAIKNELARRAANASQPANPNQLAKALKLNPQTVYRMMRPGYGFKVSDADRMLKLLGLEVRMKP